MFCENCGKQVPQGSLFCDGCGAKMDVQQQNVQQPVYTAPQQYRPQPQYGAPVMTVGQYIIMFLLLAVPLLNIFLIFKWSFGRDVNPNKKNLARTILITGIVMGILSAVMGATLTNILNDILSQMQ
ncbi:MAG: zinc ribbon domain-containing protein [Eubacteriales bacterium]|nr:zinc ribbon domain-containing protein [Eubacteriales bacterium]